MEKQVYIKYVNDFIHLISLYLNKKKCDIEIKEDELSFFYKLASHHSLRALFFKVIVETGLSVDPQKLKKFEEIYMMNVRKGILFQKEREALYEFLNKEEIDFLPLKGIVINELYPDKFVREFADNDVLFASKDKEIRDFFVSRGYKVEMFRKSNHDVYLKEPSYNFEMHRDLFAEREDNELTVNYFKNYIDKAHIKNNHEHELSDEDFYIYFTAHTYKHFHEAGCGIRTLIDYYLFLKAKNLDEEYIKNEVKKLEFADFSKEISTLSLKLFDGEELNEKEKEMLLFISSAGTYGLLENAVHKGVEEKGKFRYFMSRLFPPVEFYKGTYRWAYRHKILIPIAWLMRFFRVVFKGNKKARDEIKIIRKSKGKKKKK